MSADERVGLWPQDLHGRAYVVMTFIVGHMAVQDQPTRARAASARTGSRS